MAIRRHRASAAEPMLFYGAKQVILADVNDENLKRETARLNMAYAGKVLGLHCDVTKHALDP